MRRIILLFFIYLLSGSICYSKMVNISVLFDFQTQLSSPNTTYVVRHTIDLGGATVNIPANSKIVFKGGSIKNGIVKGDNTLLEYHGCVFEDVTITGNWNVPVVRSSMFKDVDRIDQLKNVFALTSNSVQNTVIIAKGEYFVSLRKNQMGALMLRSNTSVLLYGTLRLLPNDLEQYAVFLIQNVVNVKIKGGTIICERDLHTGTKGQWGMGIRVLASSNVKISDVNISKCWGDCIYVGEKSRNVTIANCNLYEGRRQGISITDAEKVRVLKCNISNIGGTAPEYGIDIEPNRNCHVEDVIIKNCFISNCRGGIMTCLNGDNAYVRNVKILGCNISQMRSSLAFRWRNSSDIIIKDCTIDGSLENCSLNDHSLNVRYKRIRQK